MLKEIYIKNLAVIKEAVIPFSNMLNIFTGETGAGKSILINGINAVLGQRCNKDIVRFGCDKAIITALFTELNDDIISKLDELGISHDNNEITLTREINADGGSIARINSRTSSVSVLKEIGSSLINIHGQHDNQILMDSTRHLGILDDFGGDYTLLNNYKESFKKLQNIAKKLSELKKQEQSRAERMRYLKTVIEDIESLELVEDEDETLEKEYAIAKSAEDIIVSFKNAAQALEEEQCALELIISAEKEIEDFNNKVPEAETLHSRLVAVEIELSDIATELNNVCNRVELDGQRLEYLNKRLNSINKLKRKYFCNCNELIKMYDEASEEIDAFESVADDIKHLSDMKSELLQEVTERAKALSEYRNNLAKSFIEKVTSELEFLNMAGVIIDVKHEKGKLVSSGMDNIEFLISANKGEKPKPIAKIASGGELSRIMLALKSVLADKDSIPTMIFDEIDTGVSGKAAQKIGIKLNEIGKVRQVICVTHLSQIAVMANHHLLIDKKNVDNRTQTDVKVLDFEGRKNEIARIMGGDNPSELMLENAVAELIKYQMEDK